jgi:hypothetical protein
MTVERQARWLRVLWRVLISVKADGHRHPQLMDLILCFPKRRAVVRGCPFSDEE